LSGFGKFALPRATEIERSEVIAALKAILSSKLFRSTERLSGFLRHAVESVLNGRAGELKEYSIGRAVFGRRIDFDPRIDPIVRVEAGRLRLRLKQYYETEGQDDKLRIELPKGGYVARFVRSAGAESEEVGGDLGSDSNEEVVATIRILQFSDYGPAHDLGYVAAGLNEELISVLTKSPGLRIVAGGLGASDPHLAADYVLTGSFRCASGRVRISVQLIAVRDQEYVWSETFERELVDVLSIQEEIAQATAAAIEMKLAVTLGGERGARHSRHSHDVRAYTLYLKGRYFWNLRTEPALWKGVDCFRQAVAVDSQYALAYSGLADSYTLLANYGYASPPEARGEAKDAAQQAIRIAPNLAEAHNSLAHVLATYEWRWEEAERAYEAAISLDPAYSTAHHWYGITLLGPLGRLDEAAFEIERARTIDPVSLSINRDLAILLIFRRRYDLAAEQASRVIALDSRFPGGYWVLGMAVQQLGEHQKAVELFQQASELAADYPRWLGALGHAFALWGRRGEALRILTRLDELSRHRYVNPFESALIHIGLGDLDTAFTSLQRVEAIRAYELVSLMMDPRMDPLRSSDRYVTLLDAVGLRYFAEHA
jgi:TolB-like protein/Flp pilus assembly protein TadD